MGWGLRRVAIDEVLANEVAQADPPTFADWDYNREYDLGAEELPWWAGLVGIGQWGRTPRRRRAVMPVDPETFAEVGQVDPPTFAGFRFPKVIPRMPRGVPGGRLPGGIIVRPPRMPRIPAKMILSTRYSIIANVRDTMIDKFEKYLLKGGGRIMMFNDVGTGYEVGAYNVTPAILNIFKRAGIPVKIVFKYSVPIKPKMRIGVPRKPVQERVYGGSSWRAPVARVQRAYARAITR